MKNKLLIIPAMAIISLVMMICCHSYQTTKPNIPTENEVITYQYLKDGLFSQEKNVLFTVDIDGNNVTLEAVFEAEDSLGHKYLGFTDGNKTNGKKNLFVSVYKIQDGKIVILEPETEIEKRIIKCIIKDFSNTDSI